MNYHKFSFSVLIILFSYCSIILYSCENENPDPEDNAIVLQLHNQLEQTIDSFNFSIDKPQGLQLFSFSAIPGLTSSPKLVMDEAYYYHFEDNDIFLIKNLHLLTQGDDFYDSNCFCDPGLKKDLLSPGSYIIEVLGLDEARKQVKYIIQKE